MGITNSHTYCIYHWYKGVVEMPTKRFENLDSERQERILGAAQADPGEEDRFLLIRRHGLRHSQSNPD